MRQNSFTPIALLALNAGDEAMEQAVLANAGFNVAQVMTGVYKGKEERAWLVPVTTIQHRKDILALAAEFDQESVLFSGIDRTTHLHYVETGKAELIGVLGQVDEEYAKTLDGYTYDAAHDVYYAAH